METSIGCTCLVFNQTNQMYELHLVKPRIQICIGETRKKEKKANRRAVWLDKKGTDDSSDHSEQKNEIENDSSFQILKRGNLPSLIYRNGAIVMQ